MGKQAQRDPITHELKCERRYYSAVRMGDKTFEIRLNDRDYQAQDRIVLRAYDAELGQYVGGWLPLRFRIGYILRDHPGLKEGYVILQLK